MLKKIKLSSRNHSLRTIVNTRKTFIAQYFSAQNRNYIYCIIFAYVYQIWNILGEKKLTPIKIKQKSEFDLENIWNRSYLQTTCKMP